MTEIIDGEGDAPIELSAEILRNDVMCYVEYLTLVLCTSTYSTNDGKISESQVMHVDRIFTGYGIMYSI